MTEVLNAMSFQRPEAVSAAQRTEGAIGRVQLRLRELAVRAGLGAPSERLAPLLRELHDRELAPLASACATERLRAGTAFVHGVCSLARWFDPARSVQAVPPLCVVLWHVGRAFDTRDPCTLWIDLVVPDDVRRLPAVDWAHDVRLMLVQARIAFRAETVLVPPVPPSSPAVRPSPRDAGAWGCMSLWQAYLCSGEVARGALR